MKFFHFIKHIFRDWIFVLIYHLAFPLLVIPTVSVFLIENKKLNVLAKILGISFITIGYFVHTIGFYFDSKIESHSYLNHSRRTIYEYKMLIRKNERKFEMIFTPLPFIVFGANLYFNVEAYRSVGIIFLAIGLIGAYKIFKNYIK